MYLCVCVIEQVCGRVAAPAACSWLMQDTCVDLLLLVCFFLFFCPFLVPHVPHGCDHMNTPKLLSHWVFSTCSWRWVLASHFQNYLQQSAVQFVPIITAKKAVWLFNSQLGDGDGGWMSWHLFLRQPRWRFPHPPIIFKFTIRYKPLQYIYFFRWLNFFFFLS